MSSTKLSAALATALAAAGIAAAAGSAHGVPAQAPAPRLHLVSKDQKHVGFTTFKQRPRQGDRLGFGGRISGDDTGVGRGMCTVIGRGVLCTLQLRLKHGNITAQGMLPQRANRTPIAVTGGTGAYNGARGTALLTDVSATRHEADITLLP
jgi:hypothetical protein